MAQSHIKRLDRSIAQLMKARNDISNAPEVELDIEGTLTITEVAATQLLMEVEKELEE